MRPLVGMLVLFAQRCMCRLELKIMKSTMDAMVRRGDQYFGAYSASLDCGS